MSEELGFLGIWKTRNGKVVNLTIKSHRQSGEVCFLGQDYCENSKNPGTYYTWNKLGNCTENSGLDLMERLSGYFNLQELISEATKNTTT